MSLCTCPDRPLCDPIRCGKPAECSVWMGRGRWTKTNPHGWFKFMCTPCAEFYSSVVSKPLKGIDRPEGADDEWRPSIMEHLRHAQIAMAFEQRNQRSAPLVQDDLRRPGDEKRFTPAQLEQMMLWRKGLREMRRAKV